MKRFRKLRVIVVVIVLIGLLSYFFREESSVSVSPGSTLVIELEGNYVEASGAPLRSSIQPRRGGINDRLTRLLSLSTAYLSFSAMAR